MGNLATFDGADGTTLNWHEQNDPVMGGQSIGTFVVDTNKQVGIMNGTVKVVPDLGAPGVIRGIASGNFNDVSTCKNIVLNVNSETAYPGYKVTIGSHNNAYMPGKPFYQYGYRAEFQAPVGTFGDENSRAANRQTTWRATQPACWPANRVPASLPGCFGTACEL